MGLHFAFPPMTEHTIFLTFSKGPYAKEVNNHCPKRRRVIVFMHQLLFIQKPALFLSGSWPAPLPSAAPEGEVPI